MKAITTFLFAALFTANCLYAQNIFPATGSAGIGTRTPNSSSILEIISTTKGFLPPRMTLAQRNAITLPAAGLMIYQTDGTKGLYYFNGSGWITTVAPVSANTKLSNLTAPVAVNQPLLPKTIGTLDIGSSLYHWRNIYFYGSLYQGSTRVFNASSGNIAVGDLTLNGNTGSFNTGTGYNSLFKNADGSYNSAHGYQSLYANTTGAGNTSNGFKSLFNNKTGHSNTAHGFQALYENNTGMNNTAVGSESMFSNTTGNDNTAEGALSLFSNTTGSNNTATGNRSLFSNTTGSGNVANGADALYANKSGFANTAVGANALNSDIGGAHNTATGYQALYSNSGYYNFELATGSYNTSSGSYSLYSNTNGGFNTASGGSALDGNTIGNCNTAMGFAAGVSSGKLNNSSAFGSFATATADNQVMLGSTAVTSIMAAGGFTIYSDGRFKKNIKENVPGLDFIKELRPVTYSYDIHSLNNYIKADSKERKEPVQNEKARRLQNDAIANKEKKIYTGFVAQEVEKVADKMGYDFSGVHKPQNDKDPYGLSYSDFVVPLVKAVQELSRTNEEKDAEIKALEKRLQKLESMMKVQTWLNNNTQSAKPDPVSSLDQSIPNPFSSSTIINYTLPPQYGKAKILVSDITGKKIKEINISGPGKGSIKFDASLLTAGTYTYTIFVNEKLVESKQMILAR